MKWYERVERIICEWAEKYVSEENCAKCYDLYDDIISEIQPLLKKKDFHPNWHTIRERKNYRDDWWYFHPYFDYEDEE